MAFKPSIIFDFRSQSPNNGNVLVSIQDLRFPTSPTGYVVDALVQITGPTGNIIKPFGAVDATVSNTNSVLLAISGVPITSDGNYQEGDYKFEFKFNPSSGNPIPDQNLVFKLDVLRQGKDSCAIKGNLDVVANCDTGQILVTDNTNYFDAEVVSQTITLNYPNIPNVTTPSPVVSNNSMLSASISYSNVSYSISLQTEYQHTYNDDCIIVREDITVILTKYLALFQQYSNCGDVDKASYYYDLIAKVVGCDCGCGDQNADVPELITPIGAGGTGTVVSANSPIVATVSGGITQLSLDVTFVNTVFSALQDVLVTNPIDGAFLSVTAPSSTTRNVAFNPNPLKWGPWTIITDSDTPTFFDFDIDSTANPIRYKLNVFYKQIAVDGTFILNNAAGAIGLAVCLMSTFPIPINSARIDIQIPVFDPNGACVGTIALVGTSGRTLFFLPNTSFVSGRVLNVNGIINYN